MADSLTGQRLLDRPTDMRLFELLAQNSDGVLESIAGAHGVSTFDVVRALPPNQVDVCEANKFAEVMADLTEWGDVVLIVHTPNIVLETRGAMPSGSYGRGYFNLHGAGPVGGHIRADRCAAIAFVSRPFMGRHSYSVQFFDAEGGAMFKVFVARDENREPIASQVARFEGLRSRIYAPRRT